MRWFSRGNINQKKKRYYYLVYADSSRGRPTCLGYAMSERRSAPIRKRGLLADNTDDPASWNKLWIDRRISKWYVFIIVPPITVNSAAESVWKRYFWRGRNDKRGSDDEPGNWNPDTCKRKLPARLSESRLSGKRYLMPTGKVGYALRVLTNIHNGDWGSINIRIWISNCGNWGISLFFCSSSTYGGKIAGDSYWQPESEYRQSR